MSSYINHYRRKLPKALLKKISAHLGFKVKPKYIASGLYADVYDISEDLVLKITDDKSDAASSLRLMKSTKLKYIVRTEAVFALEDELYCIVNEKMTKLSRHQDFFLQKAWSGYLSTALEKINSSWSNFECATFKAEIDWAKKANAELLEHNIDWNDFHGGNVMADPKTLQMKIIDLGGRDQREFKSLHIPAL
jgi:hypothetical protein